MSKRVINTVRSADLVTHSILVEGEQLSRSYDVMNIVVEKEVNRIPMAKLVLRDGDPASQDFELSNQNLFVPGKEIEIKTGYHSVEETIFKGIVIKHSLKIRSSQSFLIVECKDKAVKLTVGRKSKYFYERKDSEVLEEIIDSYGLEKEVETTNVTHKEIVQYNVSNWDFLVTRAQANGKICMVDNGKIYIKNPDVRQAHVETVAFGATLLDFDAEIDARNQFRKVTSYGWNASDQEFLEAEADNPDFELNGNLTPDDLAQVVGLENLELKNGGGNNSSLQEWANAKALFNRLSKIRGKVKFQGISTVKPNSLLRLEGVGERFSGDAYVTAVRHQIAEGNWTIDAQFGLNPKWFSETFDINDLPAAGLAAAVNGLQTGIVTQLENDPDGEDRILVRLPVVDSQGEGTWARVAALDAGENRGSFFRPEIDDEVIVGFINDNPNDPVVLGMLNSSAKPAPLTAADDNHEKGFITRSDIKFIFNDDEVSVTVETPNGNKLVISDDDGGIKLEDENGNFIKMDSNGITFESASAINLKSSTDLKLESGTNLELKAGAQFKAEGSAGAEISTGAIAVVKGSLVQIN